MDLRDELNLISQTNPTSRYCTEFLAATLVSPTTGKILRCSMISDGSSSKVLESDAVCMALHFFKCGACSLVSIGSREPSWN